MLLSLYYTGCYLSKEANPAAPGDEPTLGKITVKAKLPESSLGKTWNLLISKYPVPEDVDPAMNSYQTSGIINSADLTVKLISDITMQTGKYYIFVWVNNSFSGGAVGSVKDMSVSKARLTSPVPGDYIGVYGAGSILDIPSEPNAAITGYGTNEYTVNLQAQEANITGTPKLPKSTTGYYYVSIVDPINCRETRITYGTVTNNTDEVEFQAIAVPGTYLVYGFFDTCGIREDCTRYTGVYGGSQSYPAEEELCEISPNVAVPAAGINIQLYELPSLD